MKIKIAFYIESMIIGGAEKVLLEIVNNMDPSIYDVTVISLFKKSVYSDYVFQFDEGFKPHVKYIYLINNTNRISSLLFNFLYHRTNKKLIHRFLVKRKYDIEIAFYEGWPTEFIANSSQNSKKIAYLHSVPERFFENNSKEVIAEKFLLYQKFDVILAVSGQVKKSFDMFFPNLHTIVIHNPFDIELIRQKSNEEIKSIGNTQSINFITVGRLINVKGYDRLISAFSKISDKYNFTLTMIGDGELREKLQQQVAEYNLSSKIVFMGNQPNPYPFIKNADCLICSSYSEGFGNVLVEAAILGTPFLSTDCGGPKDIVEITKSGLICENSEEGLYNGLFQIFENPNVLPEFSVNAKINHGYFSITNWMLSLDKILNEFQ